MRWDSWAQFWEMGGYGLDVWGSIGMTALFILLEILQARQAHRNALALARSESQESA